MRAKPPAQRCPEVAGNVGGGEWLSLATTGESKGERKQGRCRVVSCRLVTLRMALSSVASRWFSSLACWRAGVLACWESGNEE